MNRRTLLCGLTLALAATPRAAQTESVTGAARIGILVGASPTRVAKGSTALLAALRDLGWIEGHNITIERRFAYGDITKLPTLASALVQSKVDLILAYGGNEVLRAVQQATSTIPIVMIAGLDPEANGFVDNLRRPGRNITGTAWDQNPNISGKYLEFLKELVPRLVRVGGIIDLSNKGVERYRKVVEDAAPNLGLMMHYAEVIGPNGFEPAFTTIHNRGVQAVLVHGSSMIYDQLPYIISLAARYRLPAIYVWREAVIMNGLMSYGLTTADLPRRTASYVDRILKGAKPGELPVELPSKYELIINRRTARVLGLTIPPSLLARADEVIE
jgi:putative ABC transport system substrate-binding protein